MTVVDTLYRRIEGLKDYQPVLMDVEERRRSAVLIPLLLDGDTPKLLYTQRSKHLKHHPGQISFPGGRLEEGETGWQAAVRESFEEIGMPPHKVQQVGRIDDVSSPRGFHVECYMGLVEPFEPVVNTNEVERIVQVDFDELFDAALHSCRPFFDRDVHYFDFREGMVWGVTGEISFRLRNILQNLQET